MTPKERLYTAISGGVPDRVPVVPKIWVDFSAKYTNTNIYEIIENPYKTLEVLVETGLSLKLDAVRQFHFPKRIIDIDGDIVYEINKAGRRIGAIDMYGGLSTHLFDVKDYKIDDPYMMAHHHYWSASEPIINNLDDVKKISIPNKEFLNQLDWKENQIEIMKLASDSIALIGDCSSATLAFYVCLRGMDRAMFDLIENPDLVHATMEKGVEIAIAKGKFNIDLGLKILRLNDSVANMSVISPNHWKEFIKPHMKQVCGELHKYDKDVRIYCHICGNVAPIIEDLIETGLDCIGPLDPLGGYSCGQLRQLAGDRISLMGGINTLSFINSTEQEIYDEAVECIQGAGEKGGFILGSGCVIPKMSNVKNINAIVMAANKNGVYQNGKLIRSYGELI